ncbi:hypothetical protein BJF90_26505 [Pseudonocardia sp. CNS-004]|nr:hypothetical protein BJF90_26505 [Pseudonocardia sp. CNS-004]
MMSVPGGRPGAATAVPSAHRELRVLRRPGVLAVLLPGALVNAATFCSFTFLTPVLIDITGIDTGWIPAVLVLFGGGSFLGVRLGARWSDTRPGPVIAFGGTLLGAGWVAFALSAGTAIATMVLVPLLGTLSFAVGSTLIARTLYAAADAPNLAGSFATASFNIGAAIGPWLGGLTIAAGLGLSSPLWVSAGLVAAALVPRDGGRGLRGRPASLPVGEPGDERQDCDEQQDGREEDRHRPVVQHPFPGRIHV